MNRKQRKHESDDMRPEYDFSKGTRGKYFRRYVESSNVVVLEPDVSERFKNSVAVNEALRSLMRTEKVLKDLPNRPAKARRTAARR
jgi:hypothetical protein